MQQLTVLKWTLWVDVVEKVARSVGIVLWVVLIWLS